MTDRRSLSILSPLLFLTQITEKLKLMKILGSYESFLNVSQSNVKLNVISSWTSSTIDNVEFAHFEREQHFRCTLLKRSSIHSPSWNLRSRGPQQFASKWYGLTVINFIIGNLRLPETSYMPFHIQSIYLRSLLDTDKTKLSSYCTSNSWRYHRKCIKIKRWTIFMIKYHFSVLKKRDKCNSQFS